MRSTSWLDLVAGIAAVACAVTVFVASVLDVPDGIVVSLAIPAATLPR